VFENIKQLLKDDLEFERRAVQIYKDSGLEIEDEVTRKMLLGFRKDETGHMRALEDKLEKIRSDKLNVVFYCPRCGWNLVFGCNPKVDQVIKCPQCHASFKLIINAEGEYDLEEVD
jgi:rubrerythrin